MTSQLPIPLSFRFMHVIPPSFVFGYSAPLPVLLFFEPILFLFGKIQTFLIYLLLFFLEYLATLFPLATSAHSDECSFPLETSIFSPLSGMPSSLWLAYPMSSYLPPTSETSFFSYLSRPNRNCPPGNCLVIPCLTSLSRLYYCKELCFVRKLSGTLSNALFFFTCLLKR